MRPAKLLLSPLFAFAASPSANHRTRGIDRTHLVPPIVFAVATIVFTWPLASNFTGHNIYAGSDPILLYALIEWERYAIFNDQSNFFNGNFYYLTPGALSGLPLGVGCRRAAAP